MRIRQLMRFILMLALIGSMGGMENVCADVIEGPKAEKRLDPSTVDAGEWSKVHIIVSGYSTHSDSVVPFDAVLVIDQSGTMADTDSTEKRLEAAKRFVSMASSGIRY